ncbi:MAG: exopolysaccharide biosynthesis polyprenyl glycosylphosphotransferase [Candidatus Cloacimonadota bacterium]|nr:MAG: exopolysaccharide biosynthesis polyprenyl glycosylphosphotransferase [Candidatus Cloacimonadota bacterium]PIE77966.1 MAG: exopolysaccharide biosynthesis polyprenyl glycosylphosphotransferase [Candidatus Delongbacteria bacterium]
MLKEIKIILLTDFITINISTFLLFLIKFKSGYFDTFYEHSYQELIFIMPVMYIFWALLFFAKNMYRSFYFRNIFDIFLTATSTIIVGNLIIYLLTFDPSDIMPKGRMAFLPYFILMLFLVAGGRVIFKILQVYFLRKGIGLRNALIVGHNKTGRKIVREFQGGKLLGLNIVGIIDNDKDIPAYRGIEVIGNYDQFSNIVVGHEIREVILADDIDVYSGVSDLIFSCNTKKISFKTVPSMEDIIKGHVKASEILGFPLTELFPEILTPFQSVIKRIFDIIVATTLFVLTIPIMVLTGIIIRLETPGGSFYSQKRVGKNFKEFTLYKFRSMVQDAEAGTGAVWAKKNDARITKVGNFIRKTRIDELPQLINVIKGEMSFVGPRPERKVFVEDFMKNIPFYYKRLQVKPGLTGWAQVKHKYDESYDDVKDKLRFDLFYIENMSLKLDFIIILNTVRVVLLGKGQ